MKTITNRTNLSLMIVFFLFITVKGMSQGQDVKTPRGLSPASELKQTIGFSEITVNYSRPRLTNRGNDRTGKIWGKLVPYGFEAKSFSTGNPMPWRAGANENTTITFSDDVMIEGKKLSAGTYGLHMAVHKDDKATIIFSSNHTSWGSYSYDEKEDVLRVDVATKSIPNTEILTYSFVDMGSDYGVLALSWEKKQIPFKISFDVHSIVLQSFRNELRSLPGFGWKGFLGAANYCAQNNINHEEALMWVDKSISQDKNVRSLFTKVKLLKQLKKDVEADKVLDEIVPLATKRELNAVAYQVLMQKNYEKAIQLYKLNAKKNPKDANMFYSLGGAYKRMGNKKLAIRNLKKSLSLKPNARTKASSERLLKELGASK